MSRKIIIFGSLNIDFSIVCNDIPKQVQTIERDNLLISQGVARVLIKLLLVKN